MSFTVLGHTKRDTQTHQRKSCKTHSELNIVGKGAYRTANLIIQTLLEGIIDAGYNEDYMRNCILKSHLIKQAGLKTSTAEKYLAKLEKAGYINILKDNWGDREVILIEITPIGEERYKWFIKINAEIE